MHNISRACSISPVSHKGLAGLDSPENCYAVRSLRRRRSWLGRRKPKPTAMAIGIAINTRVSVEVVEIFPTNIPRVNVVDLPFGSFAVTTTRWEPDFVPAGNLNVPLTVPSMPTTAVPNCVGVENNHTSTEEPGLKPPTLILISSPAFK